MLTLLVEELEVGELRTEYFNKHHKLAWSIAKNEYKILKVYQECAEAVKWIMWKILLPTYLFYNHDWIQNLIGTEDDIDDDQNYAWTHNNWTDRYKTPFDDENGNRARNRGYYSPVWLNFSDTKSKSTLKSLDFDDMNTDKNFISEFRKNRTLCKR